MTVAGKSVCLHYSLMTGTRRFYSIYTLLFLFHCTCVCYTLTYLLEFSISHANYCVMNMIVILFSSVCSYKTADVTAIS